MMEMCKGEVISLSNTQLIKVKGHVSNKCIQAAVYNDDTKNVKKRALHIDFAMSYSCQYQSEIQSALWVRANVTMCTALITKSGKTKSLLACSDIKEKDKNTEFTCIMYIYSYILKPSLNTAEYIKWTDGPFSDFKNKYMVQLL